MSDAAVAPSPPPPPPPPPPPRTPSRGRGRALLAALSIALIVLVARSASVVDATNQTWDAEYHVFRGLLEWTNFRHAHPEPFDYNDPPLGEMLVGLPVWLAGGTVLGVPTPEHPRVYEWPSKPPVLWGQAQGVNTLRHLISAWKCVLMLPGLAAAFLWARRLYGPSAGWLAWGLLLFEPTVAAMVPLATLDSIGLSFTLAAAYLIWRYFEAPAAWRLMLGATATAAALASKHTAVMLPAYALLAAAAAWWPRRSAKTLSVQAARVAGAALLTLVMLWPMTKFDWSAPAETQSRGNLGLGRDAKYWWQAADAGKVGAWRLTPMPAGSYVGSFLQGRQHNATGHPGYLWGEVRDFGWWYYFPAVATYKVPLGYATVVLLGTASLWWRRPSWREAALLSAAACWVALLMTTNVNIGWRHALLPYGFVLILGTRCVAGPWTRRGKAVAAVAVLAATASAVQGALWHPNYIPYLNRPSDKAYLAVSDSNVDWGQSARQVGRWLKRHRGGLAEPVYYSGFGPSEPVGRYVRDVRVMGRRDPLPTAGTLIVSPVNVAGPYEATPRFAPLRGAEPRAIIAETMLVFDLAKVAGPASGPTR